MYYIVTDKEVRAVPTHKLVTKFMPLSEEDFKTVGKDKIVLLNNDDISFLKDKKALSLIPMRNLYKADKTLNYVTIATLVLTFIILIRG